MQASQEARAHEQDFMTLKPGHWVNGDLINQFVEIWGLNNPRNTDCVSMTTYFYPKMSPTEGALKVRKYLFRKMFMTLITLTIYFSHQRYALEYQKWKRLLFPINHANQHWFLAVMDFEKEQFLFFDSLPMKSLDSVKEELVEVRYGCFSW